MISVIIPTHLDENQVYLNACMVSVLAQQDVKKEVFVMASTVNKPQVPTEFTVHHDPELNSASKKAQYAIANLCSKDTKGYLFLSDDVVLSPFYCAGMLEATKENGLIVSGISNNENKNRYWSDIPFENGIDYTDHVLHWCLQQPKERLTLFPVPWISFYAVYIPKFVYEMVGETDPGLECRGNDQDYCYRALKKDIGTFIHTGVVCVHFGTKTLTKAYSPQDFDAATEHLKAKYARK